MTNYVCGCGHQMVTHAVIGPTREGRGSCRETDCRCERYDERVAPPPSTRAFDPGQAALDRPIVSFTIDSVKLVVEHENAPPWPVRGTLADVIASPEVVLIGHNLRELVKLDADARMRVAEYVLRFVRETYAAAVREENAKRDASTMPWCDSCTGNARIGHAFKCANR